MVFVIKCRLTFLKSASVKMSFLGEIDPQVFQCRQLTNKFRNISFTGGLHRGRGLVSLDLFWELTEHLFCHLVCLQVYRMILLVCILCIS